MYLNVLMAQENNKLYNQEYYKLHKQKYQDVYNKKVKCESCNKSYSKLNFSKHLKTKKHILQSGGALVLSKEQKDQLMKLLDGN